jgi:lycopene cyclase-like protein
MFASACDLVVCGAGPAGLALAGACAARGMRVTCVAPAPRERWARSFAVWGSELSALGEHAHVEAAWQQPTVWLGEGERARLGETYARLDVGALQASLLGAADRGGVSLRTGRVAAVAHDDGGSTVTLAGEASLRARLVVDASGPDSQLVARPGRRAPAYQVAYGEIVELCAPFEMSLMDYRGLACDPPSFLYALPLPGGRVFFEETVLATRAKVTFVDLRRRLRGRLARMGVTPARVLEEERCLIPLGVELPSRGQRVVAFGAAGGMVHPATGYQLARVMAAVPDVAAALAGDGAPAALAARATAMCWPPGRARAWALYTFGMEALASFDHDELRAFLRAFFQLPPSTSLAFLRGDLGPAAIARAMLRVLFHAAPRVRRRLGRLLLDQYQTVIRAPEEIA